LPVGLRSHCRSLRRRVAPKPVARRGSDDSTPIKARVRDPRLCAPLPWPHTHSATARGVGRQLTLIGWHRSRHTPPG
jgi:hypothetical protein